MSIINSINLMNADWPDFKVTVRTDGRIGNCIEILKQNKYAEI